VRQWVEGSHQDEGPGEGSYNVRFRWGWTAYLRLSIITSMAAPSPILGALDEAGVRLTGPRRALVPSGVLGMLLFVFTEAMLFAGMISAHTIARTSATEWPPFGQPRLPERVTLVNTAVLLLSGLMLFWAHRSWRRKPAEASPPLLIALLLGAVFVLVQGSEWVALIGEGLTLTSSTYGSYFYLIVGCHALHATAAILGLAWAWRLPAGKQRMAHGGAQPCGLAHFALRQQRPQALLDEAHNVRPDRL